MSQIAPWALCFLLGVGLLLQWQRAEEALELSMATHNATAEISKMHIESGSESAKSLVVGLRKLRRGETQEGYRVLDMLLWALIRGADLDGVNAEYIQEVNTYLEEVGDPWQR